ncbi:hypothetical protein [Roseibium sp. MMSF_3412]|uniref:hypothetical protein n=1 Tax=Roseibium sp. MMSF_3412 TaxID=3046712 RepID=UPI00273F6765|nr:hypothetical protein [Roseibium sp. MMSF_3412]
MFTGAAADPIAEISNGLGVQVFDEICIDSLPDFKDVKRKVKDKRAENRDGFWVLDYDIMVVAVKVSDDAQTCTSVLKAGDQDLVEELLKELLATRYRGYENTVVNGEDVLQFTSKFGPAVASIMPVKRDIALTVQSIPN